MQKGDAMYRSAPALHFFCADDLGWLPVTAFYQHIRLAGKDEVERGVFVKFYYQTDRFQCGQYRHAVLFGIDRAIIAFAQAPYRSITVYTKDKRSAEGTRLCQISDMAAMQHIETTVSENHRAR